MTKYEVQQWNLCGGWSNNWMLEDNPHYFNSIDEAQADLDEYIQDMREDVAAGYLVDAPDHSEFRIVEVQDE